MLSRIHSQIPELADRQIVLENLIDEEHGEASHIELWLRFAEAMGVSRNEVINAQIRPETQAMVDTYMDLAASSPAEGLAALYAYEKQVPDVAAAKIKGLADYYNLNTDPGITFWTVHQTADIAHAGAEEALLEKFANQKAVAATTKAIDTWWQFLDGVEKTVQPN